jgi:hypothetical protein
LPPVGVIDDEYGVPTVALVVIADDDVIVHAPCGEALTTYEVVAPTVTFGVGLVESVIVAVAVSFPLLAAQVKPVMEPSELSVMPGAFGNDQLLNVYGAVPPAGVRNAVLLYVVP